MSDIFLLLLRVKLKIYFRMLKASDVKLILVLARQPDMKLNISIPTKISIH